MNFQVPERCDFHAGDIIQGTENSYWIEKELGEGTFGMVYKVKDSQGKSAALKLLKLWTVPSDVYKGLRARFVMEFETGKIKSDHLAHSYDYGNVKNNPFFVMEFCPNGDLRKYSKGNRVDYVKIGADVLCGLKDLHNEGKVHRDLKPENVLLRKDNTAVLTDFGISGDQNKRMTERGIAGKPKQLFGTYPYMPPEQVNPPRGGKATVLPTTDIFSFGVMMYEMMVGKLPFGKLEKDEHLYQYLENGKKGIWDREALNEVDNAGFWVPIIERCLEPDYKVRISSAEEVMAMLPKGRFSKTSQPSREFMTVKNGVLLRVMQGEGYGKVFRLNELISNKHRVVTLGRLDDSVHNDIGIVDNEYFMSRCHCTFEYDDVQGLWIVRDGQWRRNCYIAMKRGNCLGCTAYCRPIDKAGEWKDSKNGTYLNSTEVGKNGVVMNPGDIITVGDVKLRVEGY
jgi:serine/threonine protein kinase